MPCEAGWRPIQMAQLCRLIRNWSSSSCSQSHRYPCASSNSVTRATRSSVEVPARCVSASSTSRCRRRSKTRSTSSGCSSSTSSEQLDRQVVGGHEQRLGPDRWRGSDRPAGRCAPRSWRASISPAARSATRCCRTALAEISSVAASSSAVASPWRFSASRTRRWVGDGAASVTAMSPIVAAFENFRKEQLVELRSVLVARSVMTYDAPSAAVPEPPPSRRRRSVAWLTARTTSARIRPRLSQGEQPAMSETLREIEELTNAGYQYGFSTELDTDIAPPGLNEDVVRLISAKKNEPEWLLEWRLSAYEAWTQDGRARLGQAPDRPDRLPGDQLLGGAEAEAGARQHGRRRSRDPRDVRQARHPAARAEDAQQRRRRRHRRLGVGDHHVQGDARRGRRDLLLVLRGGARPSRPRPRAPRLGRAGARQLLRSTQLGGVLRRVVLLHPQGRALPDGAVDVLPHQLAEHRPVRAHADRRRGRLARVVPRGLHGAAARREPAPRGRRRAGRQGPCRDQVLDRAELVSGRRERRRRHLQLRHQARPGPHRRQDLLDPGRDRLGDHLEVPERDPAGRPLGRRVLLGGADRASASRPTPARR